MAKAYETTLERKLANAYRVHNYPLNTNPGEVNICYVEGMNLDGTPNNNAPNKFNDVRIIFTFQDGIPIILGKWDATTEPGSYFVQHPINEDGAARIAFGYYVAWQVGWHRENHEALIQTGGEVSVARDANKDYVRAGDRIDTGWFGINQHWGYDADLDDVGRTSAGCLVGRSKQGHREFMSIVKSDPRYKANNKFIYGTAIFPVAEVF